MNILADDDRLRELPCLIIAVMIHGALLSSGLPLGWRAKPVEKAIAVDFVASLPKTTPPPAPAPVPARPEKILGMRPKGPAKRPPRAAPKPKTRNTAAIKQAGAKPPKTLKKRVIVPPAQRKMAAQRQAQARQRAELAAALRLENERVREENLRAARQAAAEIAQKKALAAQQRREQLAQARAEQARLAAEARAERARIAAEKRAAHVRRRAEVSQQLALLADPDEALADAVADDAPIEGPVAGSPKGKGVEEAPLPAASRVAAQPREGDEPVYELEAEGRGGSGGGAGGGANWSLEGPAGGRRLLKRVLPDSPDWVSQRGLELAVKIKFQVQPDGLVRPGAVIKSTSGFPEIDRRALEALKRWRFEAHPSDRSQPWGVVTFRFLMS